jgi:hypothetical protein
MSLSSDGQNPALSNSLQSIARNIGRLGASVLSAVPLAALCVSIAGFWIAAVNWKYQRTNYATQVINNMVQSFGRPVEQEAIECMELINSIEGAESNWAKARYLPIPATHKDHLCFANYTGRDADDARGRYVRHQIASRLNNFDTVLQTLRTNLIDAQMICDTMQGLMRQPQMQSFIRREVLGGPEHGRIDYPGISKYYLDQPCGRV